MTLEYRPQSSNMTLVFLLGLIATLGATGVALLETRAAARALFLLVAAGGLGMFLYAGAWSFLGWKSLEASETEFYVRGPWGGRSRWLWKDIAEIRQKTLIRKITSHKRGTKVSSSGTFFIQFLRHKEDFDHPLQISERMLGRPPSAVIAELVAKTGARSVPRIDPDSFLKLSAAGGVNSELKTSKLTAILAFIHLAILLGSGVAAWLWIRFKTGG